MAGDARMRFEDYVVGPANEAAVSAARAVADAPGLTHNPLLIHGASGVGKSHLLSAIANALAPGVTVEYLSVDAFGDLWRAAEASGDAEQFLDRLSHLDVLLLDDLQTIAEPPGVQEQLVRLIAERDAAGRQLVVASDRPLRDISGLDDALSVRLASGVVVQLASAGDASAGGATGLGDSLDFQSFLTDIASAVAEHVEGWKMRVAEAVSSWNTAGYRTAVLERLRDEPVAPANYEAVLRGFGATVRRLKELEAEAVAADPAKAGHEAFRDPERLREAESIAQRARSGAVELPSPSVEFSRAGLEVGKSNQHAVRAADAVAAEPGRRYNPLFVVGAPGTGKTHLLNALGNELANASGGAATVACVDANEFAIEFLAALREDSVNHWRARYRRVDALLMDDVQVLSGKERTQEELFHLFSDLIAVGKQVVFASERAPRDLSGLDDRLRLGIEAGLVVELAAPDAELREQLYRRFLDGVPAGQIGALAAYLSSRPASGVQEIVDTVHRLTAAADAVGSALTVEMARRELEGPEPVPAPIPTPVRSAPAVRAAADVFFLDDEKIVWDWRDVASRVLEELR